MAGELVPLVLIPRYTTYAGNTQFTTIGMDVTEYSTAIVNVWRGKLLGTGGPTFKIKFQESTDQTTWSGCAGVTATGVDPGEDQEGQWEPVLNKRWFRAVIQLDTADAVSSCWAVGFLEERLT